MTQTDSINTLPVSIPISSCKVVVKTTERVLFQGSGKDVFFFFLSMKDKTYRTISNLSIVECK
jgi:hypothetical protein